MSDQPSLENLLRQGVAAAQQGNRDGAKVLFQRILAEDKNHDRALYWMAYISEDSSKKIQYLEAALRANPANESARKALKKLRKKRQGTDQRVMWLGGLAVLAVLVISALLILVVVVAGN